MAVLALFLAVNFYSALVQAPIAVNDGIGFDGWEYFDTAAHFSRGERPLADGPFVYRIGTPVLACILPGGPSVGTFRAVNLVANGLTAVLLALWLRPFIGSRKLRVLLCALFLTQWHGPVRLVHFYPVTVDPWAFSALLAGLIGIRAARVRGTLAVIRSLDAVSFIGVLFKEILILVPVALIFVRNPIRTRQGTWTPRAGGWPPWFFLDPLVFGVLGILITRRIATQANSYSYWQTALHWAYAKPLLAYLAAWFASFGPVLVFILYRWRLSAAFLSEHQAESVLLFAFAASAWVGGTDTERILYFAAPVVYLLLGKCLESCPWVLRSWGLVLALVVSQSLSQRLLWPIPNFGGESLFLGLPIPRGLPLLTPLARTASYWDMWSTFGHRENVLIALLEYILLGAALLVWLKRLERRSGGQRVADS